MGRVEGGGGGGAAYVRASHVAQRHITAAPHPSRCNSRHGIDRASSAIPGMASGCMLHVACCMLHVACCHPSRQNPYARTHARAQRASPDAFVCMALADEVVGATPPSPRALARTDFLTAAAHTVHPSLLQRCRLAACAARGRRCREGAAGGRDGEEPGRLVHRASASLQGTPQRRRWALAARMLHRVCCALPAHVCSQLPHVTLTGCAHLHRDCALLCVWGERGRREGPPSLWAQCTRMRSTRANARARTHAHT